MNTYIKPFNEIQEVNIKLDNGLKELIYPINGMLDNYLKDWYGRQKLQKMYHDDAKLIEHQVNKIQTYFYQFLDIKMYHSEHNIHIILNENMSYETLLNLYTPNIKIMDKVSQQQALPYFENYFIYADTNISNSKLKHFNQLRSQVLDAYLKLDA